MIDREELATALEAARLAQTEFWAALTELEAAAGQELEITNTDLGGLTADDILDMLEADDEPEA